LSPSIAMSSARIDLSRPTNSGITMCGNTTTSRRGSTGSSSESLRGRSVIAGFQETTGRAARPPTVGLWGPAGGDASAAGAPDRCGAPTGALGRDKAVQPQIAAVRQERGRVQARNAAALAQVSPRLPGCAGSNPDAAGPRRSGPPGLA